MTTWSYKLAESDHRHGKYNHRTARKIPMEDWRDIQRQKREEHPLVLG